MSDVVGVRFKCAGKIYYFDPAGLELNANDCVVVDTGRGAELGWVIVPPKPVSPEDIPKPLKPILRKASQDDLKRAAEFGAKEKEAMAECARLVASLNLPMKLLSAEYNLDGNHITFFFSAEGRVDFRQLVRELAGLLKVQVELRQVGPRDEAKLLGGFGRCGRPLCCMSFLSEFNPVSIRMAKDQDLPLNPMKISGTCGRLLCCLAYEHELYRAVKSKMPRVGQNVNTSLGLGKVIGQNPLKETVMVEIEGGAAVEVPVKDVQIATEGTTGKPS